MAARTGPTASARERLLAAADELFYAEGVHTVGIDRVIDRAAADYRRWVRSLLTDLARECGVRDAESLGRQLHLLYDGASLLDAALGHRYAT
jgi:AcrR family transcriptional regulator